MKTDSIKTNPAETAAALAHPHDLLVRLILSDPELAADFLRNYVDPGIIGQLDLGRLKCEAPENIDSGLTEFIGDLRFSTRFLHGGKRAEVFVFLEHQSRPDRLLSFRILEYIVKTYRTHLTARKGKNSGAGTFPYPLAVVLYHGKTPWRKVPRMRDLLAGRPFAADMSGFLDYPLYLIDLSTIPEGDIKGLPAVRVLLSALQARAAGKLASRLTSLVDILEAAAGDSRFPDWLYAFTRYVMSRCRPKGGLEAIRAIWRKFKGEKEAEEMTTTLADELMLEGEKKGEAKGKTESILGVLKARFGSVPADVRRLVTSSSDLTKLDSLISQAATCKSLAEFKQHLR